MPVILKELCGPDHYHNKKEMQWTPKLVPKKHKKKILKTSKKKAGIAFHYHKMGHAIDFENTQIIAEEKNTGKGW